MKLYNIITETIFDDANHISSSEFVKFTVRYFPQNTFQVGNRYRFSVNSEGDRVTFVNVRDKSEKTFTLSSKSRHFYAIAATQTSLNPFKV